MLTRRGWSIAGAAVGLFIGGRLLGLVQLAVLAVIATLLLIASYVWVRLQTPVLTADRALKERLQVGVDGRVDLEVRTARRTPTVAVADAFDHGRRAARFLLAPMRPGEIAHAAYRFPTDRRGRFEIGPLRATVSDAFGLATSTRRVLSTEEVMTLRDYAPGDDLRHVHWRSTARRGHLMMRQNETRRRAPVLVVLDVRPGAHDRT
jgi:uncharacterized protein (DUF58 family)